MTPRQVFYLVDDSVEGGHPWVVLTVPFGHPPKLVIGNFTKSVASKDQSCVVQMCDEPCLTKDSLFSYQDARVVLASEMSEHSANGEIVFRGEIQQATLDRIYEGAAITRLIPNEPLNSLDMLGLIPTV